MLPLSGTAPDLPAPQAVDEEDSHSNGQIERFPSGQQSPTSSVGSPPASRGHSLGQVTAGARRGRGGLWWVCAPATTQVMAGAHRGRGALWWVLLLLPPRSWQVRAGVVGVCGELVPSAATRPARSWPDQTLKVRA